MTNTADHAEVMQRPNPLDILYISNDTFPPFRVDVAVLYGDEMKARGHTTDWILQSEDYCPEDKEVLWKDARVYVGATNLGESIFSRLHKHFLGIRNDFRARRLLKRKQYDLLVIKDKFISAIMALVLTRNSTTRFVYWISYPYPEASVYEAEIGTARYPLLYRIRGEVFRFLLYRLIAPRADMVVVQSEQMKRDFEENGIDSSLLVPIPMGFTPASLNGVSGEPRPNTMVYIGTLLKTRRLDFLVRVLVAVKRKLPDAQLLFVGPEELPGDKAVLVEAAEKLNVLDSIVFTGGLTREEALGYVARSSVALSPFYPTPILNSTSPTKLIEYMALGKAVVANDHPEQKLVLERSGGGLCVPYEEKSFAEAVVKVMRDEGLANRMGQQGKRWVYENRTYSLIAERLEAEYTRILG